MVYIILFEIANMDSHDILKEIEKLVKQYLELKSEKFIPNESKISMASPPYGSEEIIEAIDSLLNYWVTMGDKVKKFEEGFANYIGTKHAIMVNSGSSANLLAMSIITNPLLDSKLEKEDEVITPALTWATTVYPIVNAGLKPVFVDVNLDSFNIDVEKIEAAISEKTRAIMPVHILGNPVNMKKIKEIASKHNLKVIEDSCEAHGAEYEGKKVGSFGDMSTFSFFVSHHITTIEGGMLLTDDEQLYELGKALRAFGWIRDLKNKSELIRKYPDIDPKFLFFNMGFNIRPTDIQGAFGMHQINKLENFIKIRRENAEFLNKKLSNYSNYLQIPNESPNTRHAFFGYAFLVKDKAPFSRKQLSDYLTSKNIEVRSVMSGNIVEHPSSNLYEYRVSGNLVNSSKIMKDGIFIPNHQDVRNEQREFIAKCIIEFIEKEIN